MKWKFIPGNPSPIPQLGQAIETGLCLAAVGHALCGAYLSQLLFLHKLSPEKGRQESTSWAAGVKQAQGKQPVLLNVSKMQVEYFKHVLTKPASYSLYFSPRATAGISPLMGHNWP